MAKGNLLPKRILSLPQGKGTRHSLCGSTASQHWNGYVSQRAFHHQRFKGTMNHSPQATLGSICTLALWQASGHQITCHQTLQRGDFAELKITDKSYFLSQYIAFINAAFTWKLQVKELEVLQVIFSREKNLISGKQCRKARRIIVAKIQLS